MGMDSEKKNRVILSLTEILENEIVETMPEAYNEVGWQIEDVIENLERDTDGSWNRKVIRRWIRDKVTADIIFLESLWKKEEIEQYEDGELIKLLKVLFYIRKEDPNFFYRKEGESAKANKSINSHVGDGELNYDYEEYGNLILKKWNETFPDEMVSISEDVYNEARNRIMLLEHLKGNIMRFWGYNADYTKEKFKDLLGEMTCVLKEIKDMGKNTGDNMNVCLLYVDVLSGIIRDILIFVYRVRTMDDNGDDEIKDIVYKYIKYAGSKLRQEDDKTLVRKYHCIYNYVMHILLLSTVGERKIWKDVTEIIINEQITPINRKRRTKSYEEECYIIADWFKEKYPKAETIDDIRLMKIIYSECFVNKKAPAKIAKRGSISFVNFLKSEERKKAQNMTKQELFYFEKILAGIAKENGTWESYREGKKQLLKLYDFEIEMFEKTEIGSGYLGKWVEIMNESFREVLQEYNLL